MPVYPAGFAAGELGHVGIFLLRHNAGAGAKLIRELDKAKTRAHPQDQFFRQPRNVGHDQRGSSAEFDGEIPIGHRIQRILANGVESQFLGDELAINRIAGSGQSGGAQRQTVDPLAAIGQPANIPLQHLKIGHEVMAKRHRLCHLQMGETRHKRGGVGFRQANNRTLQRPQCQSNVVNAIAQIKPNIGRDLIVARAARVQPLARVADQFRETLFDIEVHIFLGYRPNKPAGAYVRQDQRHAALNIRQISGADDLLSR